MRQIGIIGCSGFIGSHLLERLLKEEAYSIVGIDTAAEKIEHVLPQANFSFVQMDYRETEKVREVCRDCDTIISLAALCNPALYNTVPREVITSNFTTPLQIVSLCARTGKKLIHFSTCEVYGKTIQGIAGSAGKDNPSQYLLSEDTTPLIMGPVSAQRWSYAAAKQLLERVIYAYGEEGTLEYTIIRPFNFIGPRMDFIPGIDG